VIVLVSLTISLKEDVYDRLRDYCRRNKVKPSLVIAKLIEIALPILEEQEQAEKVKAK